MMANTLSLQHFSHDEKIAKNKKAKDLKRPILTASLRTIPNIIDHPITTNTIDSCGKQSIN
jgi:hypothetical protein